MTQISKQEGPKILLQLLFCLPSLPVFTTSAVSPIFSPVLPNFRFVGEARVAGVVDLGGELRFFDKREARLFPKKREIAWFFESGLFERGWFVRRETGTTIQEPIQKRGKREANTNSRVRREAKLIKDPRFVPSSCY